MNIIRTPLYTVDYICYTLAALAAAARWEPSLYWRMPARWAENFLWATAGVAVLTVLTRNNGMQGREE